MSAKSKTGWLDVKIGVALVWTKFFCVLEKGQFHMYSNSVDRLDPSSSGENLIRFRLIAVLIDNDTDFEGDINLVGATLLASKSSSYIEIRSDDISVYIKFNSVAEFELW